MARGDFLDPQTVAKAYSKPKGKPVARPRYQINPQDVTDRYDHTKHGPYSSGACGDSFGAMGGCIKTKGHGSEDHRDANGYGWTREAPEKRFVKPVGELVDHSQAAGGSQMMVGDSEAPERAAAGRAHRMRLLQSAQFGGHHAVFGSQN
jgi:hypothetical protein